MKKHFHHRVLSYSLLSLFGALALFIIPSLTSAQTANQLSITAYGATGGDTSDDTAAINSTINAAKAQGKWVYIPAGTFYHREFTLNNVSMTGAGNTTAILYGFDADNPTVFVEGSGVTVSNVQIKAASSGRTAVDWPLFFDHVSNFTVDRVIVDGGNSGGILNYGGSNGKIINSIVRNTLADAIHNTDGAHDIIIANNTVRNAGDDMIAVVNYGGTMRNFLIQDNDVADQSFGRGITVAGGSDVTVQGNKISNTNCCAGINISTETAWTTPAFSNVLVKNNQLSNNSGSTGHGAILVWGGAGLVDRVRIEGNTITNPVHHSIWVLENISNIALINNTMNDPEGRGINNAGGSNVHCSGNTLNGGANNPCSGANNFTVTGSSLTYTSPCPGVIGPCSGEGGGGG
ncbi:MAG: right-handed parallel beta-helix repeat-containing protein, partial [Nitrososphaera sp.]